MPEPWYTRLYKFLAGYSYAEDQERTIHPPQTETIHPPHHVLPRSVGEPIVMEPAKPAKRLRIRPLLKGRKKRKE